MNTLFQHIICIILLITSISCNRKTETVESTYPNGNAKVISISKEGVKMSQQKFYENGEKETEGSFNEKGERTGIWKYWYQNGNLWSVCEYKNGKRDGKTTVYYKNGNIRYEGSFSNNQPSGAWTFKDEEGNIIKTLQY